MRAPSYSNTYPCCDGYCNSDRAPLQKNHGATRECKNHNKMNTRYYKPHSIAMFVQIHCTIS